MEMHRLRWACRRGMLELDLVLLPFVENVYSTLDSSDQQLFDKLLDSEDTELFNWFLEKGQPDDPELQKIVRIVLNNTGLRASDSQ